MKNGKASMCAILLLLWSATICLTCNAKDEKPEKTNLSEAQLNLSDELYKCQKIDSSQSVEKANYNTVLQLMEIPQSDSGSQGELLTLKNGKKLALPLLHTSVNGDIEGFTARVMVEQIYVNSGDSTIEALYTFPLPENAAVDSMVMEIGDKRIKGVIKERQEARAIYEEAKSQGKATSLLEQQRSNIFTQSVANILPGDTIIIMISYLQQLKYKQGTYLFNFPMVVGPRYIPGYPLRTESTGTENPTDQVPDAHVITPPLLPPATRSGHDISLKVIIHKCIQVKNLTSQSHRISVSNNDSSAIVSITPNDQIPNKDFILEYTVANDEIGTVFLTHKKEKGEGFFQLIMVPKISIAEKEIFPRELVFVVDNSGSMQGLPLGKCKELMKLSLEKMRRDDLFRIIKFAGSTEIFSSNALPSTDANVRRALEFVDQMQGGGGTEMMSAINAIFNKPTIDCRKKLVLFITDGYVGNEREIISTIRNRLGDSRVFSLGVGSSVNRYLLEGIGYAGRGNCMIIRQDGEAKKVIDEFYSNIDAPVLTNLTLTWNGVSIIDPQPTQLPDLFQNQPLSITGQYTKGGNGTLTITGTLSGRRTYHKTIDIVLPKINKANSALPTLWARKKIEVIDLLGSNLFDENGPSSDNVKNVILKLGLQYKIMTQYTSFVAVDDAVRNRSGRWTSIEQPVELPEGVSEKSQPGYRYTGGGNGSGACTSIHSGKGMIRGSATSSAQSYSNGGSATGIDAILNGLGGLQSCKSGAGKNGTAGIGYGAGYGSGVGGSGSGLDLKKRGALKISAPEFLKGGNLTGARSKESIMRIVMQNLAALRYTYNKRLRDVPGLKGKVSIKFKIDHLGKVINCEVVSTTLYDTMLENEIVEKIKRWQFEKIDKADDITEVVYPFVFSM
jgi:Ca-activated chloride channel family protein